jgi:hypothetical protein
VGVVEAVVERRYRAVGRFYVGVVGCVDDGTAEVLRNGIRVKKGAVEAARLRGEGLTYREIAERMGLAESTVSELVSDPDGSKVRERKARYGGTCEVCGGPTDGSYGLAKAPKRCAKCLPRAQHGRTRYSKGCRCDECRRANTEYKAALRKTKTPPKHGKSGYMNYGCRCDICRKEHNESMRQPVQVEYRRLWAASVKGSRPPWHGTSYIYQTYGCRCSDCTAADTAAQRAKRARRKARSG